MARGLEHRIDPRILREIRDKDFIDPQGKTAAIDVAGLTTESRPAVEPHDAAGQYGKILEFRPKQDREVSDIVTEDFLVDEGGDTVVDASEMPTDNRLDPLVADFDVAIARIDTLENRMAAVLKSKEEMQIKNTDAVDANERERIKNELLQIEKEIELIKQELKVEKNGGKFELPGSNEELPLKKGLETLVEQSKDRVKDLLRDYRGCHRELVKQTARAGALELAIKNLGDQSAKPLVQELEAVKQAGLELKKEAFFLSYQIRRLMYDSERAKQHLAGNIELAMVREDELEESIAASFGDDAVKPNLKAI